MRNVEISPQIEMRYLPIQEMKDNGEFKKENENESQIKSNSFGCKIDYRIIETKINKYMIINRSILKMANKFFKMFLKSSKISNFLKNENEKHEKNEKIKTQLIDENKNIFRIVDLNSSKESNETPIFKSSDTPDNIKIPNIIKSHNVSEISSVPNVSKIQKIDIFSNSIYLLQNSKIAKQKKSNQIPNIRHKISKKPLKKRRKMMKYERKIKSTIKFALPYCSKKINVIKAGEGLSNLLNSFYASIKDIKSYQFFI